MAHHSRRSDSSDHLHCGWRGQASRKIRSMPITFNPQDHYNNCTGAVATMTTIAKSLLVNANVGDVGEWDQLKSYLNKIGTGAAQAKADIEALGATRFYKPAYLATLDLASTLFTLEINDLQHTKIPSAGGGFNTCRDLANIIRDPFNWGSDKFPPLAIVPSPGNTEHETGQPQTSSGMEFILDEVSKDLGEAVTLADLQQPTGPPLALTS